MNTERAKNDLAADVARMSRIAGSPINAYHARADVDELFASGAVQTIDAAHDWYCAYYGVTPSWAHRDGNAEKY